MKDFLVMIKLDLEQPDLSILEARLALEASIGAVHSTNVSGGHRDSDSWFTFLYPIHQIGSLLVVASLHDW